MVHDFRLSGTIYISKAGSTDTIGTSPDAPQAGLTGQEPAGVYNERSSGA